jgi:imidazolonepropionase
VTRVLWAERVVTCDPARSSRDNPLGVVERARVAVEGERIVDITECGPEGATEAFAGCVITPGLVDAHTHAAWLGSRHAEYAIRMGGGDYRAIAAAGGGILASQRAIAKGSEEEIAAALAARLRRMAALGVTAVEVKSGYGLEPDHELKQLRAIARAATKSDGPVVVPTFLALHALPESARNAREGYVRRMAEEVLPRVAEEKLARFVDAYVDANAFTVGEARAVGLAARARGLGVRMHVGQFADVGGAELCAELGARSADHLENIGDRAIALLATAGTHAVLLPVASFTLAQSPPPVAKLRAARVPLVVASDANPGTAPTESLPLALALAVRAYGLSPEEALLGATRLAASSLDLAGRGVLAGGGPADLTVWDLPHEHAIVQPWGAPKTRLVLRDGRPIAGSAG